MTDLHRTKGALLCIAVSSWKYENHFQNSWVSSLPNTLHLKGWLLLLYMIGRSKWKRQGWPNCPSLPASRVYVKGFSLHGFEITKHRWLLIYWFLPLSRLLAHRSLLQCFSRNKNRNQTICWFCQDPSLGGERLLWVGPVWGSG
jgi:hypothetical protein